MSEFAPALAQLVFSLLFGAVLFLGWRRVAGARGPIFWLVTAGVFGRAVAGQLLFWVSYLGLPVGKSLQAGNGLWFFALDAIYYVDRASHAARAGLDAIIFLNRTEASVFYIQTLAMFGYLFGSSPATALLLNITAYLGTCAIVLKLAPPDATRSRIAAVAALSLTPSIVLWSLQPLKDVFFLFLVALFVFACDRWQRLAVRAEHVPNAPLRRFGIALLMAAALYGVSGIRWYFGMALVAASGLFLLLASARGHQRRMLFASSAAILVLLLVAFRAGGGPYIPEPIRHALTLNRETPARAAAAPGFIVETVERSRRSFEKAAGATTIGAGPQKQAPPPPATAVAGAREDRPAQRPAQVNVARRESARKSAKRGTRNADLPAKVADASPAPAQTSTDSEAAQPQPAATKVADAQPQPASASPAKTTEKQAEQAPASAPAKTAEAQPPQPVPAKTTERQPEQAAAPPPAKTAQARPSQAARAPAKTPQKQAARQRQPEQSPAPAPVKTAEPAPPQSAPAPAATPAPATAATPAPVPAVAQARPDDPPTDAAQAIELPKSPVARFATGAAAVVLPKTVAEALGLFRIGGGRGFWLFVELDTLVFDLMLLYALYCVATAFRAAIRTPSFWLVLAALVLVGVPLIYTVSNFGTLFRHRNMLYMGLVLLPLTIAMARAPRSTTPPSAVPAD